MKGVYARASSETMKKRIGVYRDLLTVPLDYKLHITRKVIAQALEKGPAAILYSGGRDSTVLLHLARQAAPDILVIYNNTTLGDPRTDDYIRAKCREMNYIETTAEDPIAMWQRKGYYPILSKRGFTAYKKIDPSLRISPVQCCYQLKEKYAYQIKIEKGIKAAFWGNRASESMRRRLTFLDNGYLFKPKRYPWWQAYPLQHWTDQDIDRYLAEHEPDYLHSRKEFETGCLCCGTDLTFWPNNLSRLFKQDQEKWEGYMKAGFAEQIMKLNGIDGPPEEIIRTRPEDLLMIKRKPARRDDQYGRKKDD
jgi:3'-phosphoadenosine 5'-phosphosulfate sulfotransferase (PAPS reductase)/FAD synthetase